MQKVRIDVPDLVYAVGLVLTIITASHILPISWSSLCNYWLLTLVYNAASLITTGVINEVNRAK